MPVVYRYIHTSFWDDDFIQSITPEDKYFYLYALTNPHTTQCGIYQITPRTIAFETGYNAETVQKLLKRFAEYKRIYYSGEFNELYIVNWLKYNGTRSPKIAKYLSDELRKVRSPDFKRKAVISCLKSGYGIDTLSIGYQPKEKLEIEQEIEREIEIEIEIERGYRYPIDTLSPEAKTDKEIKRPKNKYGEFGNVYLTTEEYQKLETKLNSRLTPLIEKMSAWLKQNGKTYKDYYAALINWGDRDAKENIAAQKKGEYERPIRQSIPGNRPAGAFADLDEKNTDL